MMSEIADTATTARADEIARFDALAGRWWDPRGPMRMLHAMNPARVGWIEARIAERFAGRPVRLLDIGCGAGLAAEALAKLGHDVVGLDAAPAVIAAATAHAEGLPALSYEVGTPEQLVSEGRGFQVVTALEVIEHVADPTDFLAAVAALLEPGGLAVVSTLNRTWRSLAVAKIGAEYLARLLPVGTHDWRLFLTPNELAAKAREAGLAVTAMTGLSPDPRGGWRPGRDMAMNYIAALAA